MISSPLQISGILLAVIGLFGVVWIGRVIVAVATYLWGVRKRGYASHLSGYEVDLEQPKNATKDSTRAAQSKATADATLRDEGDQTDS